MQSSREPGNADQTVWPLFRLLWECVCYPVSVCAPTIMMLNVFPLSPHSLLRRSPSSPFSAQDVGVESSHAKLGVCVWRC